MKRKTDDQLMSEIAKGKNMAFAELFDRHSGAALGYAVRLLGDKPQAEDQLQEAWMKVVKLAPSYKSSGHFKAWLYTLIRNSCLNQLRKKSALEFKEEDVADVEGSAEDSMEEQAKIESLNTNLNKLPVNQRTALLLWAVEDMDYQEIGRHMGVSLSAVKSLIFRARSELKSRRLA